MECGKLKNRTAGEAQGEEHEAGEADTSAGMGNQLVEQEAEGMLGEFGDEED